MNLRTDVLFGVHLWIWILVVFSASFFIAVILYWQRERLRKFYYTLRYKERVLKVIIHFPSRLYKVYWRLIPSDGVFTVDKKDYVYDAKLIEQEDDFFVDMRDTDNKKLYIVKNLFVKKDKDGKQRIKLGKLIEKEYSTEFDIRQKGKKYSEVHYVYNNPQPITFDYETGKLDMTGEQLKEFKDNNLFMKLLTMQGQKNLMMFIILLGIFNAGVSLFLLAKEMGWIE